MIQQAVMQPDKDFAVMEPLRSEPETMISTLHYLDERYGGAAGYLRLIGLSDVQIDTLKSALID
ncbi:MAG: tyrosine-protein phosphatase [Chloroflexi bacterium]|nr:tyrosine-protein phosphatase [Chloroflexota bacterium]